MYSLNLSECLVHFVPSLARPLCKVCISSSFITEIQTRKSRRTKLDQRFILLTNYVCMPLIGIKLTPRAGTEGIFCLYLIEFFMMLLYFWLSLLKQKTLKCRFLESMFLCLETDVSKSDELIELNITLRYLKTCENKFWEDNQK